VSREASFFSYLGGSFWVITPNSVEQRGQVSKIRGIVLLRKAVGLRHAVRLRFPPDKRPGQPTGRCRAESAGATCRCSGPASWGPQPARVPGQVTRRADQAPCSIRRKSLAPVTRRTLCPRYASLSSQARPPWGRALAYLSIDLLGMSGEQPGAKPTSGRVTKSKCCVPF